MKDLKKYINLFDYHNIKLNADYDPSYNINNTLIIGVTGSKGKSSACYMLYDYFRYLNKKVCIYSSALVANPYTYYTENACVTGIATLHEMSDFIAAAEQYMTDVIIIECNAEAILNHVYDDLEFDYKVLTVFDKNDNEHIDQELYLNTKINFLKTKTDYQIINIDGDNVENFLEACPDAYTFSNDKAQANLFGTFMLPYVDKSYIEYTINNQEKNLVTTLPLKTGCKVVITFLGIIAGMNLFAEESINDYLENYAHIPGRLDDQQWADRTILIDSGNEYFIKNTITELNSDEFKNARQAYIQKYGKDFIEHEYNNIRVLCSIAGGITDSTIYDLQQSPTFNFINPSLSGIYNESEKKLNIRVFGYNLYNLITGNTEITEESMFYPVKSDVGEVIDYSGQTILSATDKIEIDNQLQELYTQMYPHTETPSPSCYVYRNSEALYAYFMLNADIYTKIFNIFRSVNYDKLNAACAMFESIIEAKNSLKKKKILNQLDPTSIVKLYLTFTQFNSSGMKADLYNYKNALNSAFNCETKVDRKEAIMKILKESEPGDLVLICGRGTRPDYLNEMGEIEYWTDHEYIQSIINKEQE